MTTGEKLWQILGIIICSALVYSTLDTGSPVSGALATAVALTLLTDD